MSERPTFHSNELYHNFTEMEHDGKRIRTIWRHVNSFWGWLFRRNTKYTYEYQILSDN